MTLLIDRLTFAFFGARSPSETHFIDCSMVSSMLWWIHVSSTVTKRRKNSFVSRLNTPLKWSHGCAYGRVWAIVAPIARIAFSCRNIDVKYDVFAQLICLQLQPPPALSFYDRSILYHGFYRRFLEWLLLLVDLNVRRPGTTTTKLSEPLLNHWKWWCRVSIVFIKLFLAFGDSFLKHKIVLNWHTEFTLFHFTLNSWGCLLSMAAKQKLIDAACSRFHSSLFIDGNWREQCCI